MTTPKIQVCERRCVRVACGVPDHAALSLSSSYVSAEVDEEDAALLAAVLKVGNRVKMAMKPDGGGPTEWEGGTLFEDTKHSESLIIAFDDGDPRSFEKAHLRSLFESKQYLIVSEPNALQYPFVSVHRSVESY